MSENDEKSQPGGSGGEIVSIEDARKKAEEKNEAKADPNQPPADPLGGALQPIMAAIARELAGLAGPDGKVDVNSLSADEASKAKTQALLRGLGQGLGEVLAQAMGKWADKVNFNFSTAPTDGEKIQSTPVRSTPPEPPPGADDPTKK
jgi:hypothetical protein